MIMAGSEFDLANYLDIRFSIKINSNISFDEIDNMLPYEYDVFITQLNEYIEEKNNIGDV